MTAPIIIGPETHPRDTAEPPGFTIVPGAGRFYGVEVATEFVLFWDARARTNQTFFASWQGGTPLPSTPTNRATFTLPHDAWLRLRIADFLYYRLVTSSSAAGWVDAATSVEADAVTPPRIQLRGRFLSAPHANFREEELLWRRDPAGRDP